MAEIISTVTHVIDGIIATDRPSMPRTYTNHRICLDHLKGQCTNRRANCRFMHPDLTEYQRICSSLPPGCVACEVYVMTGECKFGPKCSKVHPVLKNGGIGSMTTAQKPNARVYNIPPPAVVNFVSAPDPTPPSSSPEPSSPEPSSPEPSSPQSSLGDSSGLADFNEDLTEGGFPLRVCNHPQWDPVCFEEFFKDLLQELDINAC